MTLAGGQALSFYEILGPIGAGGMGEVCRARDTRLDREVAVKVLPEALAADEDRLRRFEREAKTLASLNHANLAHVYGIDQVEDTCFMVMELVPGEDLGAVLARGALPVNEAIEVCRQIAEGLEAAHEAGVIHRDLKPVNVVVTPGADGSWGPVILVPFPASETITHVVWGRNDATEARTLFGLTENDVCAWAIDVLTTDPPTFSEPRLHAELEPGLLLDLEPLPGGRMIAALRAEEECRVDRIEVVLDAMALLER